MNQISGISRTLLIALAATLVVTALVWPQLPSRVPDSGWYRMMASGHGDEAPRPFANRVLHTGLAAGLMDIGGFGADTAFLVLGLVSLFVFLAALMSLLRDLGSSRLAIAVFAAPLLIFLLRDNSLPDLPHAALTALAFLALRRRPALALPVMFALGLTRESSLLLAGILAIVLWRDGRRIPAAALPAATIAGAVLAWSLGGGSETMNVHRIGAPLYILLKAPFNLSLNLLGLELWANTFNYCDPPWAWHLPGRLSLGTVDTIGVCGMNAQRPVFLAAHVLGTFGILPALLLGLRRRTGRLLTQDTPVWIRAALVYGLAALALTPALGAATARLLGYAWPAFWIAAPLLLAPLARDLPDAARTIRRLAILHLSCGWLLLAASAAPESTVLLEVLFLAALVMNIGAYRMVTAKRDLKVMAAVG